MIEAPVHYCASKAALKGLTQALAKEVARYGIRVICLAPGLLEDGVGRNLPDIGWPSTSSTARSAAWARSRRWRASRRSWCRTPTATCPARPW